MELCLCCLKTKDKIGAIRDKRSWEWDESPHTARKRESEQGKVTKEAEDSQLENTWAAERAEAKGDQSKALGVLLVPGVAEMQVLKIREPRPSPVTGVAAGRGALPAPRCAPGVTELPKIAELLSLMGLAQG